MAYYLTQAILSGIQHFSDWIFQVWKQRTPAYTNVILMIMNIFKKSIFSWLFLVSHLGFFFIKLDKFCVLDYITNNCFINKSIYLLLHKYRFQQLLHCTYAIQRKAEFVVRFFLFFSFFRCFVVVATVAVFVKKLFYLVY